MGRVKGNNLKGIGAVLAAGCAFYLAVVVLIIVCTAKIDDHTGVLWVKLPVWSSPFSMDWISVAVWPRI